MAQITTPDPTDNTTNTEISIETSSDDGISDMITTTSISISATNLVSNTNTASTANDSQSSSVASMDPTVPPMNATGSMTTMGIMTTANPMNITNMASTTNYPRSSPVASMGSTASPMNNTGGMTTMGIMTTANPMNITNMASTTNYPRSSLVASMGSTASPMYTTGGMTTVGITTTTSRVDTTSALNTTGGTTSTTTLSTVPPSVNSSYYVGFYFTLNLVDENVTVISLALQLRSIFTTALGIVANQINITVIIGTSRIVTIARAQVALFSTNTESADQLLTRIKQQVSNSSSPLRQQNLTSQLNETSIQNVTQYYVCFNGTSQQSPCSTSNMSIKSPISSSSLLLIILALVYIFD